MITSSVLRDKNSMFAVGLDLGDKFSYITIVDQNGKMIEESRLPSERDVSASTHTIPVSFWDDQPLSALSFLFREVLGVELDSPFVSVCLKRNKGFGKA